MPCRNREAIELCQEVIRLAPNAADAYHTIGTIQEAMGNPRKALDFYMIAAHLPPKVCRKPSVPFCCLVTGLECCWDYLCDRRACATKGLCPPLLFQTTRDVNRSSLLAACVSADLAVEA